MVNEALTKGSKRALPRYQQRKSSMRRGRYYISAAKAQFVAITVHLSGQASQPAKHTAILASSPVHKCRPHCFTNHCLEDRLASMSESHKTQRNLWAQLSISACVLLLPPMALGAAVFSMLPARDGDVGRAADAWVATSKFRVETTGPLKADPQPVTQRSAPLVASGPTSTEVGRSTSLAGAFQEPVRKKDMARLLGPVPVRVTVVTPPASSSSPPLTDLDSAPTGATDPRFWQPAAVEVPIALLPRALTPPPIQTSAPRSPVSTQVPVADRSSTEEPAPASTTRKRSRLSYLRTLTGHSGARADARTETQAVHRNAQPQQTFSLKDWLQQKLGAQPRDTRG